MSQRVTHKSRTTAPSIDLSAVLAAIVYAEEMWPDGVPQVPEILGEIDDCGKVEGAFIPLPTGQVLLILGAPVPDCYDLYRVEGDEGDPRRCSIRAGLQNVPFDELSFSLATLVRPTADQDIELGRNAHLHPGRVEEAALSDDEWSRGYFLGCLAELAERGDKRSELLVELAGDGPLQQAHIDMADVTYPRTTLPPPPPRMSPIKPPPPVKGKRKKRQRRHRR